MKPQWALYYWSDGGEEGRDLYEVVEVMGDRVTIKTADLEYVAIGLSEVEFITVEQAMLHMLENQ